MSDIRRAKKFIALYGELKQRKGLFSSHLEDIASVLLPRRSGFAQFELHGERLQDEIFDNTGQQAARGLANTIGNILRPERFFGIRAEDDALNEDEEALLWMSAVEEKLFRAFENPRSRFKQSLAEADLDLVTFGTASVFIGERADLRGLNFNTLHLKDVFFVTNSDGRVDGLIRRWMPTARQAGQFFGEKAAKVVKKALKQDKPSAEKFEHIHVVMPRGEKGIGLSQRHPYSSVWLEVSEAEILTEGGFEEFPFAVPRWDTTSGEDWGRGPGQIALPDANMLQAMDESLLTAAQKAAEPPILAPDDGTFNAANTFAGGISYYDSELARALGRVPIGPMETGARVDVGIEMLRDRQDRVEAAFFKDVLNLPTEGPEMTATEIIQRKEEFIRIMGGAFGRLESEYTAPVVERSFNIMLRAGAFNPIPEILLGRDVRFEFESPIKKVRLQAQAVAAQAWRNDLIETSQVSPEVLDNFDPDAYAKFQHQAAAVPVELVRTEDAVAQIRQQRAEQQQAQQEAEEAMQLAAGGKDAAKAVKDLAGAAQG